MQISFFLAFKFFLKPLGFWSLREFLSGTLSWRANVWASCWCPDKILGSVVVGTLQFLLPMKCNTSVVANAPRNGLFSCYPSIISFSHPIFHSITLILAFSLSSSCFHTSTPFFSSSLASSWLIHQRLSSPKCCTLFRLYRLVEGRVNTFYLHYCLFFSSIFTF